MIKSMMSCRHMSRLVSQSLERDLNLWERFQLRFHTAMCKRCLGHRRDLQWIRDAIYMRLEQEELLDPPLRLPPEARERIRQVLRSLG